MSLLLLSNDTDLSGGQFSVGGIAQPNTWTNTTQTPMTIPKNAEVAVQSVKINRTASTVVNTANNIGYLYIGRGRDVDFLEQADTRPVNPVLFRPTGEYTADSFVDNNMLPSLRKGIFHPDYQNRVNGSVKVAADGDFEGYNIRFGEGDTPPASVFPADNEFEDAEFKEETSDWTWTNSNQRFTKGTQGYDYSVGQMNRYPLSARQASHSVKFGDAGDGWYVGLSRYCDRIHENPDYWERSNEDDVFYDFAVIKDPEDQKLRMYHTVVLDSTDDILETSEVEYYGYPGALVTEEYDLDKNASGYDEIEFFLDGEQLNVYLRKGAIRDLICSPDLGTPEKKNYFKPVNAVCQYLYPKYTLFDDSSYLTMTKHCGVNVTGFVYKGEDANGILTKQDLYATSVYEATGAYYRMVRYLDLATDYNDFDDQIDTEHEFQKFSDQLPKIALIVSRDIDNYTDSKGANCGELLGFKDETVVDDPTQTAGFKTFTSHETPDNIVKDSVFLRLTSLTQRSVNGYTGNESKILYHIPRFDTSGNDQGGLYFEPTEKTYVDIGNPTDIQVNSFSVDFVDRTEKVVDGLNGESIVMLHIREKK